jgi:hypothetical protein
MGDKMKKGYYRTDIVNGVYFHGENIYDLHPQVEVLSAQDFYDSLDNDEAGRGVIGFFGDEESLKILDKIEQEYGIRED